MLTAVTSLPEWTKVHRSGLLSLPGPSPSHSTQLPNARMGHQPHSISEPGVPWPEITKGSDNSQKASPRQGIEAAASRELSGTARSPVFRSSCSLLGAPLIPLSKRPASQNSDGLWLPQQPNTLTGKGKMQDRNIVSQGSSALTGNWKHSEPYHPYVQKGGCSHPTKGNP